MIGKRRKVQQDKRNEVHKESHSQYVRENQRAFEKINEDFAYKIAQMHQEFRRLSIKLGENHPRVQRIKDAIRHTGELARDLQVQAEVDKILVPETPDDGTLVHGRVMDELKRGHKGLSVYGQDENCEPVCAFGTSTTDGSGYYSFPLDAELLKQLGTGKIFVAVKTKSDRILHRQDKPLTLTPNSQELVEIVLERNRLWRKRAAGKTSKKELPMVKGKSLLVPGYRRVNDMQTKQRIDQSVPVPTQEPKHGDNKMKTQLAIETAESIIEDRKGAGAIFAENPEHSGARRARTGAKYQRRPERR